MKNTEVELRGPLKAGDRERVETFLKNSGATEVVYTDLGIFFNANEIASFGKFEAASARLQANQKTYPDGRVEQVVKLKVGAANGTEREEHEMHFDGVGLKTFLEIVKRFGITEASFRPCERHDWTIAPITMTLKFNHAIGDHFEAELMNGDAESLRTFLEKVNLTVWTEEKFKEVIMASRTGKYSYLPLEQGVTENNIR